MKLALPADQTSAVIIITKHSASHFARISALIVLHGTFGLVAATHACKVASLSQKLQHNGIEGQESLLTNTSTLVDAHT
jgi:hypothetical protein